MGKIISSASKIVFIGLALSACVAFFLGKLDQNNFMLLATSAFAFYFSNKGEATEPFAGK